MNTKTLRTMLKSTVTAFLHDRTGTLGDIVIYRQASAGGGNGSQVFNVAASATVINAGEPVVMVAGSSTVVQGATNLLALASPYVPFSVTGTGLVGVAQTTSTNTASAAGVVEVTPCASNVVYLITANNSANVNTQAKYDALVGSRVLIDLTAGAYTLLTSDSALNGCIIRPLNVFKFPGKIAFSFVDGISALM
jgi:hypothetical protein